jgi:transcriptional regulator with XRE-family HTH domain
MDIGSRLRELRLARGLSQGHIEKRTGLLRCYVSRVENGHTLPNLENLEKWAGALKIELYQLFFSGDGEPSVPKVEPFHDRDVHERPPVPEENDLLECFRELKKLDRRLLLSVARKMVAMGRKR